MSWRSQDVKPGDSVSFKYRNRDLVDAKVVQIKDYGDGLKAMLDCSNGRLVCTLIKNLMPPRSTNPQTAAPPNHQPQQIDLFSELGGYA